MKELFWTLLGQRWQWFTENVFFVSPNTMKPVRDRFGPFIVYVHFVPYYRVRFWPWGMDWDYRTPFHRALCKMNREEQKALKRTAKT